VRRRNSYSTTSIRVWKEKRRAQERTVKEARRSEDSDHGAELVKAYQAYNPRTTT